MATEISLTVNGAQRTVSVAADTPLLWVIREQFALNGTKFGCGIALCGACTVHLNGRPIRACVTPVSAAAGQSVTTIEGLRRPDGELHAVQQAWIDEQVPQCGYCQSGQIMAAAALLESNPRPDDADIDLAMRGIVCRCGTYTRIRKGIHRAATVLAGNSPGTAAAEGHDDE